MIFLVMKIAFKGVIFLLMLAVFSCKQSEDNIGDTVEGLIGTVIEFPQSFRYEINGTEIDEPPTTDFTIVTY